MPEAKQQSAPGGGPGRPAFRRGRTLLAAAALAAVAAFACCVAARTPAPEGVILLVMDTTRADRCSFLGYERPTNPRLAELARDSLVFGNAWSPAPWTLPAHASMFTGLSPERHGVGLDGSMRLPEAVPTLAEHLRDAGWATGCFTANPFVAKEFGLTRGFATDRAFRGDRPLSPEAVVPPARAPAVCGEALRWIRAHRSEGRPYFAFLNLMEAHSPYAPPEETAARFRRGPRDDPQAAEAQIRAMTQRDLIRASFLPGLLTEPMRARLSDLYDADLAVLDAEIGSFLDALRADGALDGALLVIAGDHGEGLGDHGWIEHATILNQEMLRVPLLVRLPGRIAAGSVASVVSLEDVFPTVAGLCGIGVAAGGDGVPLHTPRAGRVAFATEGPHPEWIPRIERAAPGADLRKLRTSRRSATDGRYHLIVEGTGETELFDMEGDPRERRNVADERPRELRTLLDALDARAATLR